MRSSIALSEAAVDLDRPLSALPPEVRSPRSSEPDSGWMRRSNVIGINVRTVGDVGGLVKYGLTLPADFDAVQLLPIWEPGVVKSLYGIAGWNLNYEFFSDELYEYAPILDTIEKQLRATSNLLHVMGKAVGMDVIPHTDRFLGDGAGNTRPVRVDEGPGSAHRGPFRRCRRRSRDRDPGLAP